MDSLKQRLLQAAAAVDACKRSLEPIHVEVSSQLLREAAGAIDEPLVNPKGYPRRRFDRSVVGALAHVIYDSGMHTQEREDTIGVLMKFGAFRAESVEAAQDGFIADLAAAVDAYKAECLTYANRAYSVEKAKFGDLAIGEHFVCWPTPGDNHGHGGYLGQTRLFVKTDTFAKDMPFRGCAKNGIGTESSFQHSTHVIRVVLG